MILFSIFVRHLRKKKANHSDFFFLANTNTTDILIPKGVGFIWDCSHQGNFQQTFGCQAKELLESRKSREHFKLS